MAIVGPLCGPCSFSYQSHCSPIRTTRDHTFCRSYSPLLCSWSYCRQELNPTALSPPHSSIPEDPLSAAKFLSLSLSLSLRLNGGKGYKVSPQRPIQSTVYSGNPTPAGVSVPASDHYRVVGEEGSRTERGTGLVRLLGCLHTPWFSKQLPEPDVGLEVGYRWPLYKIKNEFIHFFVKWSNPEPRCTQTHTHTNTHAIQQQRYSHKMLSRTESYQRGLCIYLADHSTAPANNGYHLSIFSQ